MASQEKDKQANAAAISFIKHDYLAQKLIDFVKKYNKELFGFQQDNLNTYLSNNSMN